MKRRFLCILLTVTLIASMLIGCGKETASNTNNESSNISNNEDNLEDNGDVSDDSDNEGNDGDTDDNGSVEDEDNNDYPFHLDYATDDNLAKYANHAEVIVHNDDYSCKILVTVDETITDVKIYALEFVDFDTETYQPIYNKTLVGQFDSITPDMPLVIQQTYGEFMATCGFSYVDAKGVEHMIGITESGEDGSVVAVEIN